MKIRFKKKRLYINIILGLVWTILGISRLLEDKELGWLDYGYLLIGVLYIGHFLFDLTHQDLGQIQIYVTYYDREVRLKKENKIIGIVLSKDKNESVVKYTLPEKNEHIFASKYKTVLQSKDELKLIISERKR